MALLLLVAGSAYLLGRSARSGEEEATAERRQATEVSYARALTDSRRTGHRHGFRAGRLEGMAAGRKAGELAGGIGAAREIQRRAGVSADVSAEAAAAVAASEQAEAEDLYYRTHPWVDP
ncbi:MAG TPA: hypothetical protein VFS54_10995 [Solirubrobacterales bacterium]|nr:hypothetical protein [Solirubrobacterales bacterium]